MNTLGGKLRGTVEKQSMKQDSRSSQLIKSTLDFFVFFCFTQK